MKKVIFILTMVVPCCTWAQIDYTKIIVPSNVNTEDFQEKLVQLAWKNHPSNRISEEQVQVQREIMKQQKMDWISSFGVSGNVNEFVLNPSADEGGRAAFFPKYNISGRLDLGQFFVSPAKRRENVHRIRMAEEAVNVQKLELRNNVLKAYQDYLKFLEFYKIQAEITQDAYSEFLLVEQNFKNGTATTEDYNKALRSYNLQRKEKIGAENQYLKSKYDLEFFIGMKIEEIL